MGKLYVKNNGVLLSYPLGSSGGSGQTTLITASYIEQNVNTTANDWIRYVDIAHNGILIRFKLQTSMSYSRIYLNVSGTQNPAYCRFQRTLVNNGATAEQTYDQTASAVGSDIILANPASGTSAPSTHFLRNGCIVADGYVVTLEFSDTYALHIGAGPASGSIRFALKYGTITELSGTTEPVSS